MKRNKIGFVDTDSQEEQETQMGYAETHEDDVGFIQTISTYFLMGYGIITLLKEVVLFLVRLKRQA